MTLAWYGHLRNHCEPKMGYRRFSELGGRVVRVSPPGAGPSDWLLRAHPQLKIIQEVVTLGVFAPFAVCYMHQPLKLDYFWAGLCLMGAVYFIFRS